MNNNKAWSKFVTLMTSKKHSNISKFNPYGELTEKVKFIEGELLTVIINGVSQEQIIHDLSSYEFLITSNRMFNEQHFVYIPVCDNDDVLIKLKEQYNYIECGSLDASEFYFISDEHQPVLINREVFANSGEVISKDNDTNGKYDGLFVLKPNEYISDIAHLMDFSSGKVLIIADVGTGKSVFFSSQKDVKFIAPLTAIKESIISGNENVLNGNCNVSTWNAIDSLGDMNEQDKANVTLVVDECHGLVMDSYKQNVINRVYSQLDEFKSVVFMSGTVDPSYFSNVKFDRVYRVMKPSIAKKTVNTTYTKNIKASVIEHLQCSTDKAIVLLDNIPALKSIAGNLEKVGKKSLIITSKNKTEKHIQSFFESGLMGSYDVVLGTSCIVEGLSIEDKLETADVIIGGHITPERMEQFTNRFRKVSKEKNVHYFINFTHQVDVPEFITSDYVNDTLVQANGMNAMYNAFVSEAKKSDFVTDYRRDQSKDCVFFYDGEFHVSYTSIDLMAADNRAKHYQNDFKLFEVKLGDYGFDVRMPVSKDGNAALEEEVKADIESIVRTEKEERIAILDEVITDIKEGVYNEANTNELYEVTVKSISKLSKKGLADSDIEKLVELYKEDDEIFRKAHSDADSYNANESISKFIERNLTIDSNRMATSDEVKRVAALVVNKVLNEYFAGDVNQMVKSKSWGSDVELSANGGVVIKNTRETRVLRRYIKVGKSKQIRISGVRVSCVEVMSFSLTGLLFTGSVGTVISNLNHTKKVGDSQALKANGVLSLIKSLR